MLSPDDPHCAECKRHKRTLPNGLRPVCFPQPVSKLEEAAGQEKYLCEHCGSVFLVLVKAKGSH